MFLALVNCLGLTFGPYIALYHGASFGEGGSWRNILSAFLWFVVSGIAKIFLGSIFLPTTEGVFSIGEEFVNFVLRGCDVLGLFMALRSSVGTLDSRIPTMGWAFGFYRALTSTFEAIWLGAAKSSSFDPTLLARCLAGNTEMLLGYACSVAVWYCWKGRRASSFLGRLSCPVAICASLAWPTVAKLLEAFLGMWVVLAIQTAAYSVVFLMARALYAERPKY
ncbi:hypothetical protein PAPYR_3786 [Paratrimastix pyriformis]|uniref:BOS complex subunit TMEM147 n=1 Tax=Paratrimastix pyriformis TaxID=342808 RepID=A0ABQ8UTJ4_9EUKA|nr:hypothetical protein PAPYR_3786 [Paratrimastix pyriformis]